MKGYWVRCFEMRLMDRTVHEVKWPMLMAARKVDLTGLELVS